MKKNLLLHLILTFMLFGIIGCVGTIQNAEEDITKSKSYTDYGITFKGIEEAIAVSHNKVDVSFFPAKGGSGNFTYVVYRDGNFAFPVASIPGIAANVDAEGKFHVPVGNLLTGTTYSFSVRAYDIVNAAEDINTKSLFATTLGYEVPVFDGIVALENVGGADGETMLKIRWNPAQPSSPSSDPFGANPNAISGYNVYLGTSPDTLTLIGSVTNPTTTQFIATNLTPGSNYFARVRAKNSASPTQEDLNIKYFQKKTLLSQPIVFSGLKTASIPNSSLGYSRINLTWNQGSGSFDRYRVFVSSSPVAAFDPGSATTTIPDISDLTATSFTISTGLAANTTYYIAIVACKGSACTEYGGHNVVKSVKTSPPVAAFNGIDSITQPSDASGLSSLIITWTPPDTSVGVYNEYRLFKVDNATGAYNPLVDQVPPFNAGTPSVPGFDPGATTDTSMLIKGLTSGTEYCFVLKAYATSPADPENPAGRTHINEKKVCGTPVYTSPGFSGVKNICSAISSSSFTVAWDTPSPLGIFDRYNIWLIPSGSTFDYEDAISGDPAYTLKLATKDKTSLNITGLAPNTTYKIGMKTYFYDAVADENVYDSNIVTATCATLPAKVEHNGWFGVTSIGRKMDGLASPPSAIIERLRAPASPYNHTFPEEYSAGTPGVDASNQGIIRLQWEDFSLSGSLGRMYDFIGPGNGYKVYRKVYQASHASIPPEISDNDWGPALNADLISAKLVNVNGAIKYIADFTDYTVTRPLDTKETKTYWYKIVAFLNNTPIAYETTPPDGVLRVVLPPDNMALVHRWMANRDICSRMGLTVQRANKYKCNFDGFTSIGGYYDMEHDLLVDRFELGCNFTRGYDNAKKCSALSADPNFEGAANDLANGIIAGDCIGKSTQNMSNIIAENGAVFYRRDGTCYVNDSVTSGTSWKSIHSLEAYNTRHDESKFPQYDAAVYPLGTGLAATFSANHSRLPPLANVTRAPAYRVCASHDIKHKGTKFLKRFLRRKEWVASASWSHLAPLNSLESGETESGVLDRDCNSNSKGGGLTTLNLNDTRYPHDDSSRGLVSGSGGTLTPSSEACNSRYGIQDMVGNYKERTSEIGVGSYVSGTSGPSWFGLKWKNFAETTPMNEEYVLDPGVMETLKTASGEYLSMGSDGYGHGFFGWGSTYFNDAYISIPLGMPLHCGRDSSGNYLCDNRTDNNTIVTNKAVKAPATIVNYNDGSDCIDVRYNQPRIITSGGSWTNLQASCNGINHLGSEGMNDTSATQGIRCGILLDD